MQKITNVCAVNGVQSFFCFGRTKCALCFITIRFPGPHLATSFKFADTKMFFLKKERPL